MAFVRLHVGKNASSRQVWLARCVCMIRRQPLWTSVAREQKTWRKQSIWGEGNFHTRILCVQTDGRLANQWTWSLSLSHRNLHTFQHNWCRWFYVYSAIFFFFLSFFFLLLLLLLLLSMAIATDQISIHITILPGDLHDALWLGRLRYICSRIKVVIARANTMMA